MHTLLPVLRHFMIFSIMHVRVLVAQLRNIRDLDGLGLLSVQLGSDGLRGLGLKWKNDWD